MERYTRVDLANKVDYEGGLAEAIMGYGITHTDLPEEAPAEVVDAWKAIEKTQDSLLVISKWLWG